MSNRTLGQLRDRSYQRAEMDRATLSALGGPVLDLGCGAEARAVCALREEGVDARGIDPGASYDLIGPFVHRGDARRLPFADASLRRIFSSYSVFLYHADNPPLLRSVLSECERTLAPGGDLVIAGALNPQRLGAFVRHRPGLVWTNSYGNDEIFGPTVVIRRR